MSSPRKWVLSVPNLTNVYTPIDIAPRDEVVFENNQFDDVLNHVYAQHYHHLPSYFKGIVAPTSHPTVVTNNMINSDFTLLNVVVELRTGSYQTIRAFRTEIVEAIKNWAANVTVPTCRGIRLYALKRPVVEWSNKDGGYVVRFDIVFSNIVSYSKYRTNLLDFDQHLSKQQELLKCKIDAVIPVAGITIKKRTISWDK